ncbi:MAG: hypothetical protein ABIG71_02810 [Candidatus Uhrbacteria bacterium]
MALDPDLKMVFEKLEKDIGIIAEVQYAHGEKLGATFEAVGRLQEDMTGVKAGVSVLKEDMTDVKGQLDLIRSELKAKADRSELHLLERRVTNLERRHAVA